MMLKYYFSGVCRKSIDRKGIKQELDLVKSVLSDEE